MDLTTLFLAVAIAFGLLTVDTIRRADRVNVEVGEIPRMDKASIDRVTIEQEFARQLNNIASVFSIVLPPEIKTQRDVGIMQAVASSLKIDGLTQAMEADLGYRTDRLRLSLVNDNGVLQGVVSGTGGRLGQFQQVLVRTEGEPLMDFIRRCSLVGATYLAPYGTTLFLIQEGIKTGDYTVPKRISARAKSYLPPTPISLERSRLLNLDGIIALMENDVKTAMELFKQAVASDPRNQVADLNAAFTEVEIDQYAEADARMLSLIAENMPDNPILRSTVYMTRAAAQLGLKKPVEADALLQMATSINPKNSSAWHLWSETKQILGDKEASERLRHRAFSESDNPENFAEVATLYMQLSWQDGSTMLRSPFRNPSLNPSQRGPM